MPKCSECGEQHEALYESSVGMLCTACYYGVPKSKVPKVKKKIGVQDVLLTTETAPNLTVTKRIEVVTAEVAYGMNFFKDVFAGMRDIVGGRSETIQNTMRDTRRTALFELKKEAHSVGANAVIGVDLDYVDLSGGAGGSMVLLVASGTAVVIEDE